MGRRKHNSLYFETIGGKVRLTEKEAFYRLCDLAKIPPSKVIRAFVRYFNESAEALMPELEPYIKQILNEGNTSQTWDSQYFYEVLRRPRNLPPGTELK